MIRVLLVEDNPGDARLVKEALYEQGAEGFSLSCAGRLTEALEQLADETFDAVLLDLGLPDAQGPEVVEAILEAAPEAPIVVLSGMQDEALAVEAVRNGAQDYLVKGLATAPLLSRALHYAVARKRAERRISHLANHDGLTDLANRRLFQDRLGQALARARREERMLALLFIDLDHFKEVNDTFGHAVGDRLLIGVADRLMRCTRMSDTVARLGGDEFCLLLPDIMHPEDVGHVAKKVLETLSEPFILEEREVRAGASIGISIFPQDGDSPDELFRAADTAMYSAKQDRNQEHRFAVLAPPPGHGDGIERIQSDGRRLREAVERGEFVLHYQPLVDLSSGDPVGVEALVRWRHPSLGVLPPACFLPLAETTGLVVPIGEWVLVEACSELRELHRRGFRDLSLSVNLSRRQLVDYRTRDSVRQSLAASGIPPERLQLDVAECGVLADERTSLAALRALKDEGVQLSLDEFGAGVSSLTLLKNAPIDEVKINRALLQNVTDAEDDAVIVKSMIRMAHGLRMATVGTWVETAAQANFLMKHRCDRGQGYFFSYPMPADRLLAYLESAQASVPEDRRSPALAGASGSATSQARARASPPPGDVRGSERDSS